MKRSFKTKPFRINMKSVNAIFTFLLFLCPNLTMAQQDSTSVSNDSITWNKELDGVVVKAQMQLIKQEIDRIGYDVQADEESKTSYPSLSLRLPPRLSDTSSGSKNP